MGFLKRLRSDGVFLTHLDAAGTKDDQMLINILPQVAATVHGSGIVIVLLVRATYRGTRVACRRATDSRCTASHASGTFMLVVWSFITYRFACVAIPLASFQ